jgi:ribosomal protein S18 acetylase RimI-like enzyme
MRIRHATSSDAQVLAEFGARTFEAAFGHDNKPQDMQDYLQSHYSVELQSLEIADPKIVTLLAEDEGELVGFVQLRLGSTHSSVTSTSPIELWRIYIEPDRMGSGLAQALMEAAKREAIHNGGDAMWLSVWQENPRAIAFYRKEGFEIVGEKDFWVGSDQQFDFVMMLDLGMPT